MEINIVCITILVWRTLYRFHRKQLVFGYLFCLLTVYILYYKSTYLIITVNYLVFMKKKSFIDCKRSIIVLIFSFFLTCIFILKIN